MSYKNILRQLVEYQQYTELKYHTQDYLAETTDIQALPLLALAYAHLGEFTQCIIVCKEIETQIAELDISSRIDLACVYCLLHRLDDAIFLLEAAQNKAPNDPIILARLARCRLMQERPNEARTLYQRSIELAPDCLSVLSELTSLVLKDCDHLAAQQFLDKAIIQLENMHKLMPISVIDQFTSKFRIIQLKIWLATDHKACAEQWLTERCENIDEDLWVKLVIEYTHLLEGKDKGAEAEYVLGEALKHYPKSTPLLSKLAALAKEQGRTQQAIDLLQRAIYLTTDQDMQQVDLWVCLSRAYLHKIPKQARKAADKAFTLVRRMHVCANISKSDIQKSMQKAKSAQAEVESQSQNFKLAETLFTEVLIENPTFLPALQNLTLLQIKLGKIDRALELFERIKQIEPIKENLSFINIGELPEDKSTLALIEKVACNPSLEGSVRSELLLQLAIAWNKHKEYEKAFKLAIDANETNKQLLDYDPKSHRNSCARIRASFCPALFKARKVSAVNSTLPVYLLGMPGSGIALASQIIAGNSDIFAAGELGLIPKYIQGLNRREREVGSGRSYPDCVDDLTPDLIEKMANEILEELEALAAEHKPKAKHVVDMLAHNFENIGLIKLLFPNAKIISVRRDPLDIAISNYFAPNKDKKANMGFAYDLEMIGEQLADHNLMMHHWEKLFPGEILEVSYEDLIYDLEGGAHQLFDYIGGELQASLFDSNRFEQKMKAASNWHGTSPIYKTSKGKWKHYEKYLSPLIKGTNAKILADPINDMITLPEPGFLAKGIDFYKKLELDSAEICFKKMLHYNPEHATCHYMLGLIYLRKNHIEDGIVHIEKALKKAPWNKKWHENLLKGYQLQE